MPTVAALGLPRIRQVDNNGKALAGGRIYTYAAGTTTPAPTYTDATGTVANPNPIILNARGEAAVWLDTSLTYKFVTQTANGTAVATDDNISAAAGTETLPVNRENKLFGFDALGNPVAVDQGTTDTSFTPAGGSGMVTRTLKAKAQDVVASTDYTTVANAVTAMQNAGGGTLVFPSRSTSTTLPSLGNVALEYYGPNASHSMYDETTQTSRAARLFRGRDPGGHAGTEHSVLAVEAQPVGSGSAAVPDSDFALNISAVKKDWPTTSVRGQVVALNIATRGGCQLTDGVNGNGDMSSIVCNNVQASPANSVSVLEGGAIWAQNGQFLPGQTWSIGVQLGIMKRSDNLATGLVLRAQNGPLGDAISIDNRMGDSAGDGTWTNAFKYVWNDGTHAPYEAFKIGQVGEIIMSGPGSVGKITQAMGSSGELVWLNSSGTPIATLYQNGTFTATGPVGTAPSWATYAPAVTAQTGTVGSYSIVGARYIQQGKLVTVHTDISITSAGSASGDIRIALPVTAVSSSFAGTLHGLENTLANKALAGEVYPAFARCVFYDGSFPGATGNRLIATMVYEAA